MDKRKIKKLIIPLDKACDVDSNQVKMTKNSLRWIDTKKEYPITDGYGGKRIGSCKVFFEGKTNTLFGVTEIDPTYYNKFLAPKYSVQNEDIKKIDGVTVITKAELMSVGLVQNHSHFKSPLPDQK